MPAFEDGWTRCAFARGFICFLCLYQFFSASSLIIFVSACTADMGHREAMQVGVPGVFVMDFNLCVRVFCF